MEVRPGYKQTEVGEIPEDWEVAKLGKHVTFKTGPFGSALHQSDYVDGGVPVVNPMQIVDGKILPTSGMSVTETAARKLSDFQLTQGDVVIGRRGEMGRCAFVQPEQQGWLCGTGSMIIRTGPSLDAQFIQRVLASPPIIGEIENASVGSTMINLNQGTLRNLLVPLPPTKAEQEAIAEALSDADALLDGLDRLIAEKRNLKQAAMQQLLTGQSQLPGFYGEWEVKRLEDFGAFLKGQGIRKDEVVTEGLPSIRYGEIYTHHHDHVRAFNSFITPETAKKSRRLEKGDLLFAGSGETAEEIGKCVAFLSDVEAYAGGDIVIFRPSGQSSEYLGYVMNYPSVVEQKARMGQGDAVVHISARNLARLQLHLPHLPEQIAIASVLTDVDVELAALEQRMAKTRDIKQAMMQELLTGKTRLVSPEAPDA